MNPREGAKYYFEKRKELSQKTQATTKQAEMSPLLHLLFMILWQVSVFSVNIYGYICEGQ